MTLKPSNINILITGGSGFIGQHLVKCVHPTHQITLVDHHPTDSNHLSFIKADFTDPQVIKHLHRFETVYHLAWRGTPASQSSWNQEVTHNITPSIKFINQAKLKGVKHFIFISSAGAVYGKNPTPFVETQTPKPISNYGRSKVAVEAHLQKVASQDFKVTIIRPTNAIDLSQSFNNHQGVIPALIQAIKHNKPFQVWGNSTKDYLAVTDLAEFLNACLEPTTTFDIFNLGSGQLLSVDDIVNIAQSQLKSPITTQKISTLPHDIPRLEVSTQKAREKFAWHPQTDISALIASIFKKSLN